jgi:hypothetical protein
MHVKFNTGSIIRFVKHHFYSTWFWVKFIPYLHRHLLKISHLDHKQHFQA